MNIPKDVLSYTIAVIFTISFFSTLITMGLIIKRRQRNISKLVGTIQFGDSLLCLGYLLSIYFDVNCAISGYFQYCGALISLTQSSCFVVSLRKKLKYTKLLILGSFILASLPAFSSDYKVSNIDIGCQLIIDNSIGFIESLIFFIILWSSIALNVYYLAIYYFNEEITHRLLYYPGAQIYSFSLIFIVHMIIPFESFTVLNQVALLNLSLYGIISKLSGIFNFILYNFITWRENQYAKAELELQKSHSF